MPLAVLASCGPSAQARIERVRMRRPAPDFLMGAEGHGHRMRIRFMWMSGRILHRHCLDWCQRNGCVVNENSQRPEASTFFAIPTTLLADITDNKLCPRRNDFFRLQVGGSVLYRQND